MSCDGPCAHPLPEEETGPDEEVVARWRGGRRREEAPPSGLSRGRDEAMGRGAALEPVVGKRRGDGERRRTEEEEADGGRGADGGARFRANSEVQSSETSDAKNARRGGGSELDPEFQNSIMCASKR